MEPRHAHVQNPQICRGAQFCSGAAIGAAIALVVATALLHSNSPVAGNADARAAPALPPKPVLEYSGTQGHYPDVPEEQPPTF